MTAEEFNRMTNEERNLLLADSISENIKSLAKEVAHRKRTAKMELDISSEEFDTAWDLAYRTACLKYDQMTDLEFKLISVIEALEKNIITTEDLQELYE